MLLSINQIVGNVKRQFNEDLKSKRLSRSDECIMKTIFSISTKYHKTYCNPKLSTLQKILYDRYKIKIAERTLRLHLRILEAKQYLIVRKKVTRLKSGQILGMPNLYFVTRKMRNFLKGIVKQTAIWISKDISLMRNIFLNFQERSVEMYIYAHQKYGGKQFFEQTA